MKNIVDKEWLKARMGHPNLVILDCRFSLGNPQAGEEAYQTSHLPASIYCHLEKDLSGPVTLHGGRHPLPDLLSFKNYIEKAGIQNDSIVVAYDNGEGAFAARLWWLMKYIGHNEVYVLNGGYQAWTTAGYPVESMEPVPQKTNYSIHLKPEMLATIEEVKKIVAQQTENTVLIDSRESKRYLGHEEPIDSLAGRIPGAINKFWNEGFKNGLFKSLEEQLLRFSELSRDQKLVVYCGSGVTAAPNFLILNELGYQNLKLYVGSYSDWISYQDNRVESEN